MRRDGARVVLRVIALLGISGFAVWAGCGDDAASGTGEASAREALMVDGNPTAIAPPAGAAPSAPAR